MIANIKIITSVICLTFLSVNTASSEKSIEPISEETCIDIPQLLKQVNEHTCIHLTHLRKKIINQFVLAYCKLNPKIDVEEIQRTLLTPEILFQVTSQLFAQNAIAPETAFELFYQSVNPTLLFTEKKEPFNRWLDTVDILLSLGAIREQISSVLLTTKYWLNHNKKAINLKASHALWKDQLLDLDRAIDRLKRLLSLYDINGNKEQRT